MLITVTGSSSLAKSQSDSISKKCISSLPYNNSAMLHMWLGDVFRYEGFHSLAHAYRLWPSLGERSQKIDPAYKQPFGLSQLVDCLFLLALTIPFNIFYQDFEKGNQLDFLLYVTIEQLVVINTVPKYIHSIPLNSGWPQCMLCAIQLNIRSCVYLM